MFGLAIRSVAPTQVTMASTMSLGFIDSMASSLCPSMMDTSYALTGAGLEVNTALRESSVSVTANMQLFQEVMGQEQKDSYFKQAKGFYEQCKRFSQTEEFQYMKSFAQEAARKGAMGKAMYDYGQAKYEQWQELDPMEKGFDLHNAKFDAELELAASAAAYALGGVSMKAVATTIGSAVNVSAATVSSLASLGVTAGKEASKGLTVEEVFASVAVDVYEGTKVGKYLDKLGVLPSQLISDKVIDLVGDRVHVQLNEIELLQKRVHQQTDDLYQEGMLATKGNSTGVVEAAEAAKAVDSKSRMDVQIDKYDEMFKRVQEVSKKNPDDPKVAQYLQDITNKKTKLVEMRENLSQSIDAMNAKKMDVAAVIGPVSVAKQPEARRNPWLARSAHFADPASTLGMQRAFNAQMTRLGDGMSSMKDSSTFSMQAIPDSQSLPKAEAFHAQPFSMDELTAQVASVVGDEHVREVVPLSDSANVDAEADELDNPTVSNEAH